MPPPSLPRLTRLLPLLQRRRFASSPPLPPPPPPPPPLTRPLADPRRILATLLSYCWPRGQPALRLRVVAALALLVGAKLVNIQVPFLFKDAADFLALSLIHI